MSKNRDYELLVNEGREQEKKYDWVAAIEPYGKALTAALKLNDSSKAAKIYERIGFCYQRAAMQAKNLQEFKNRMLQAINAYNKAAKLFEKAEGPEKLAKICHCKAIAAYVNSWLKPDFASRKRLLDECLKLEKEALKFYEGINDRLSLGKTCNELSMYLVDRLNLEWDTQIRQKTLKEALSYGEKAIAILSERGEEYELARAYYTTSIHYRTGTLGLELEKKRKYKQKFFSYSKKAVELSEKIGDHFLLGMSNISLGSAVTHFADRSDSATKYFENALQCGIRTRDNYLIGRASYLLAHLTAWKMVAEEDPEKIREESKKCEKYSEDAIHHFSLISYDQEIASSYYWYAENYIFLAKSAEIGSKKKRILLKKSIEAGRKGLEHARRSGSISATWLILHPLSKSLFLLSTLETAADVKKQLLEESLRYREENIKALEQAMPYYFWNQGVRAHYLALIQAELSEIETEEEQRVKFLEDAIKSAENCIDLCLRHGTLSLGEYAALGGYYSDFGRILNRLYLITGTYELLSKLIEVFKGAVETYEKANLPSRAAEGYWQLANAYNKLQNYAKSAESFELAHKNYILAAQNIPPLKDFYLDHASYMKGWSEIEKARHSHTKEEYGESKEHNEKAAGLLKSSRLWSYLAPNYLALAHLEHGEDLSRKEKSKEAIQAFQQAAKLFSEAKRSLEEATLKIESNNEKERALALSKTSETRREYCKGRILLEEARIHDRESNTLLSAEKYSLAIKAFQKVAEALEEESERKELYLMIYFCQAWEKMKLAEQRVAPELFLESSRLFIKAKKYSVKEKTSLLAMGNSALCKALEAGTKFEETRDLRLYSTAKRNMESAANYYLKAGFNKASTWVNANQTLLDAYIYMSKAETETIHEEKIRQYRLAEKYLERSAKLYKKAGYTGKKDEVLKVLAKVREKHEFALSLSAALKAPTLTSSTTVFSVPTSTQEEAVGLERFEHVNIQAYLSAPKEVIVAEEFEVRIDLANIAKESGLLVRVDELIPTTFKVTKAPTPYTLEGRSLNAKGKQLAPHKVESIKISVQATQTGSFQLCPEVIYVDELGKFKRFRCEAIPIIILPPAGFQFKTDNARKVFEYLTKAFIEDYMKRRLTLEKSGWRTFVQIKENAKVPKSSVYGTVKRRGYAISELENRGVVETRIFSGERGRGGRIIKARVYYDKETIKRYIDQHVMKIKEK